MLRFKLGPLADSKGERNPSAVYCRAGICCGNTNLPLGTPLVSLVVVVVSDLAHKKVRICFLGCLAQSPCCRSRVHVELAKCSSGLWASRRHAVTVVGSPGCSPLATRNERYCLLRTKARTQHRYVSLQLVCC